MSDSAKILSLSSTSAAATITSALKTYYRSVRLIKNTNVLSPTNIPSYITNILLCGNCIDPENRNLYVFYIDTLLGGAWIIEINIDTREQVVVYYDKYNAIGFGYDPLTKILHKIYNAKVVHGRLVWTDNLNPIYQMDILRAKKSFYHKIGYGQYPVTVEWIATTTYGIDQIVSNGNNFYKSRIHNNLGIEPRTDSFINDIGTYWTKLCLIEDAYYSMNVKNFYFEPVPPVHPPVVSYESDDTRKINNLRQTLFQIAYRYVYMDWRKSTFSPASIVPVPQAEEETATGLVNEMISLNNKLKITVNTGGEEVRAIEIIGRSSQDPSKWFLIETVNKFEEQERGGEVSVTSEPGYISLTMTVMSPIVLNVDGIPDIPVASEVLVITQSSFLARWNASARATGYVIDVSLYGTFLPFTTINVGNVLSYDITGLIANQAYYYRVRAYNTTGMSANSNVITLNTLPYIPVAPIALEASDVLSDNFVARWDASVDAIGYILDVATDIGFTSYVSGFQYRNVMNVLTFYVYGLMPDTTYYYKVRAATTGGLSPNSNIITVTTSS